jgi:hypothetical protein
VADDAQEGCRLAVSLHGVTLLDCVLHDKRSPPDTAV